MRAHDGMHDGKFENISQRAVYSYIRLLVGDPNSDDDGKRQLNVFFKTLYDALYNAPAQFGLPVTEDDCIDGTEENRTKRLAELNRKLQKPRELIAAGLDFLMEVGWRSEMAADPAFGQVLLLDRPIYQEVLKTTKVKKPFISGLAGVGLEIVEEGSCVVVRSARFPHILMPLKGLALACSRAENGLGRLYFGRCDFNALDLDYQIDALELYRGLRPEQYQHAAQLHEYFTGRGYKPIIVVRDVHGWLVQYQGKRQIKSTPLFQMEYSERFQEPLRIQIKCASTNRIAPLIAQGPRAIQEDFFQRTFECRGSECDWCKTKKNMGPGTLELDGVRKTACWYSNPDVKSLDDAAVSLIEQYAELHEGLG